VFLQYLAYAISTVIAAGSIAVCVTAVSSGEAIRGFWASYVWWAGTALSICSILVAIRLVAAATIDGLGTSDDDNR
jgi:hypothetical protein